MYFNVVAQRSRASGEVRPARLVALLALSLSSTALDAATFNVTTAAELSAAIAASDPGDFIYLATGNYGTITIKDQSRTGAPVTLMPAAGAAPVLTGLSISGSSGFAVIGLRVSGTRHPVVGVASSSDIRLGGLRIEGAVPNKDAWDDPNSGLWIRNSQRVSISNSRITNTRTAIYMQRSDGVIVADTTIEYTREGINVAATNRLLLRRNRFQIFQPNYAVGDHADAIQFWTTNETSGSSNVVIADNYFALGGPRAVQGIFVAGAGDPESAPDLMHEKVEVRNNIYYGSARNGLRLGGVRRGFVHRNTLVASPHADLNSTTAPTEDGRTSGGLQPWVAQMRAEQGRTERNIAPLFSTEPTDHVMVDNLKLYDSKTKKGEPYEATFAARPTADIPALTAFRTLDGSLARSMGAGATPPGKAGIQSSSLSTVRQQANWYQDQFAKFDSWFSPGF